MVIDSKLIVAEPQSTLDGITRVTKSLYLWHCSKIGCQSRQSLVVSLQKLLLDLLVLRYQFVQGLLGSFIHFARCVLTHSKLQLSQNYGVLLFYPILVQSNFSITYKIFFTLIRTKTCRIFQLFAAARCLKLIYIIIPILLNFLSN